MRTCYNCGNVSHFVADCPYEKREDNGGKLIRKDKTKSFPSKNNNFAKKVPQKGLVAHEEYDSDDDDDDDTSGEGVATASVAIATSSSNHGVSLRLPQRELHHHPQVPHGQGINKVTSNIKTIISTNPSLMDCVDEM